jgi:hypothetical protein
MGLFVWRIVGQATEDYEWISETWEMRNCFEEELYNLCCTRNIVKILPLLDFVGTES